MVEDFSKYKVLILAAGFGTRLQPFTKEVPKVMVPIWNGRPLLEHTLLLLRSQGFRDFVINLHYLPHKIVEHFGDGSRFGVCITYSDETKQLLDTAGAIKKVEPLLSNHFLLLYGDMLHFLDFRSVVSFHEARRALATVVLSRTIEPHCADIVCVETGSNRILEWYKRPHEIRAFEGELFANSGLYVLSKKILGHIAPGKAVKLDADVIPSLVHVNTNLFGFPASDEIFDIGTIEKYNLARQWYEGRLDRSPLVDFSHHDT